LSEWLGGSVHPLHFPVPWAEDVAISFVRPAEEVRGLLAATGFREQKWVDRTSEWLAPREAGQTAVHQNIQRVEKVTEQDDCGTRGRARIS